jgi:hypothetical protein
MSMGAKGKSILSRFSDCILKMFRQCGNVCFTFYFTVCVISGAVRSYGSLIFLTTCARSVYHHFSCEFESRSWRCVLDTALCDNVYQRLATRGWFSIVSSTNKTDPLYTTKILLKVATP